MITDGAASSRPTSATILYIEDNSSNQKLVAQIVKRRPQLRLLTADDGTTGHRLATEHLPDLVLLDAHLPDIPGEEVLSLLRSDPRTSSLRVVVVSADATSERMEMMTAAGASGYLTKPFDLKVFLALLDEISSSNARPDHSS